jgi:hypothetical protein
MNLRDNKRLSFIGLILLVFSSKLNAATFFFPDMNPSFVRSESPDWLRNGRGNDGYITITSEVIPASACTQLATNSFWGSDKTQLVLSVVTNGFKGKLDKVELPIATFDGRDSGSQCASLSSTPLQIVPLANLGAYSVFNPGNLSLVLNVKSSNDTKQDFVGSAKLLLGAAAIVATGGSAAAIGGVSATIGNSVVSDTQEKANSLLKGMIDAKVPISLNWSELRNGIRAAEITVYKSEQNLGDISDKKIQQLQRDPKSDKQLLFTVKLEFQFTRTIFYPTASNIDGLVERENLSPQFILNYQMPGSSQSFMQLLNGTSPSLLLKASKADGLDLSRVCATGFEKLKSAGLDWVDTAIVMKAFLDEAKGDGEWYSNPSMVKSCFSQAPNIESYLEKIYGAAKTIGKEN